MNVMCRLVARCLHTRNLIVWVLVAEYQQSASKVLTILFKRTATTKHILHTAAVKFAEFLLETLAY